MSKSKLSKVCLTVGEIASKYGLNRRTFLRWIRQGKFPFQAIKLRPLSYELTPELEKWIAARKSPNHWQNEHTLAVLGLYNFCAYLTGKRNKGDKLNPPIVEELVALFHHLAPHCKWLVKLEEEYRAAGYRSQIELMMESGAAQARAEAAEEAAIRAKLPPGDRGSGIEPPHYQRPARKKTNLIGGSKLDDVR